jgi:hypothetical protein
MNDNIRELMAPAKLYTPEEEADGKVKAHFKLVIKAEINDLGAANSVYEQLATRRAIVAAESLEELNRRTEEFINTHVLRPSEMITDGVLLADGRSYELRYTDDFYDGGLPVALQTITALRFDSTLPGIVVFIRSETEHWNAFYKNQITELISERIKQILRMLEDAGGFSDNDDDYDDPDDTRDDDETGTAPLLNLRSANAAALVFNLNTEREYVYFPSPDVKFNVMTSVTTSALTNTVTEKGGKIEIDYTVDIGPVTVQKNRISIEAVPLPGNITEKDDDAKQ